MSRIQALLGCVRTLPETPGECIIVDLHAFSMFLACHFPPIVSNRKRLIQFQRRLQTNAFIFLVVPMILRDLQCEHFR